MSDREQSDEEKQEGLLPNFPLDPEEALRGFMEVDPEKVKGRLRDGNTEEGDGDPS